MRDWAQEALLDSVEINNERGVYWKKSVWVKGRMIACRVPIFL